MRLENLGGGTLKSKFADALTKVRLHALACTHARLPL